MKSHRQLLHVSWTESKSKILALQKTCLKSHPLEVIKKRKLSYLGHNHVARGRSSIRHNFRLSTSRKTKNTMEGQYHIMDWFEGKSLAAVS